MKKKLLLINIIVLIITSNSFSQEINSEQVVAKIKPFSWTMLGITWTGTYSEGCLHATINPGNTILFGLVSWGGSTSISCTPGCPICRIETTISIGKLIIATNTKGEKCFEKVTAPEGVTPVLVAEKDGTLTFAIDINQTADRHKGQYSRNYFEVASPFILDPGMVKALKLYSGDSDMGYIVPAGKYPLYRDGDIYYWTFEPPIEMH